MITNIKITIYILKFTWINIDIKVKCVMIFY